MCVVCVCVRVRVRVRACVCVCVCVSRADVNMLVTLCIQLESPSRAPANILAPCALMATFFSQLSCLARPITANGEWNIGTSDTMTNVMDVVTCSYNYGEYSQFHYTHPFKPIMGGESASCTTDRGYYMPNNAAEGHMNSDDDGCVVSAWARYVHFATTSTDRKIFSLGVPPHLHL
jgi:hypothetical protein